MSKEKDLKKYHPGPKNYFYQTVIKANEIKKTQNIPKVIIAQKAIKIKQLFNLIQKYRCKIVIVSIVSKLFKHFLGYLKRRTKTMQIITTMSK